MWNGRERERGRGMKLRRKSQRRGRKGRKDVEKGCVGANLHDGAAYMTYLVAVDSRDEQN